MDSVCKALPIHVLYDPARRYVTGQFGTWQHMTIMIGRLSDPRSSKTVHSALVAQMRSAIVVSDSVDVRGFTVNKDTAVSDEEPVLNSLASLVG